MRGEKKSSFPRCLAAGQLLRERLDKRDDKQARPEEKETIATEIVNMEYGLFCFLMYHLFIEDGGESAAVSCLRLNNSFNELRPQGGSEQ